MSNNQYRKPVLTSTEEIKQLKADVTVLANTFDSYDYD